MKAISTSCPDETKDHGFALVATISMLMLLALLAVGMLSLSSTSLRGTSIKEANQRAEANARMALMIAIGELQAQMGPDMRISAEAAIHDTDPATEKIDGVAQPHWTAVYDAWGAWLNGSYKPEGKSQMTIGDTYGSKRAPMFRRWLVSLPERFQDDVNAANATFSKEETVLMVGEGTLGVRHAQEHPENVTRAYKIQTEGDGAFAWWVSPENHKAKIGLAAQKRELSKDQWATAQGVSSEVGIGGITGLENLDNDQADAASMASRIVSFKTLELSGAEEATARSLFFDLTEASSGVLANTRSGGLKKDLSLLLENNDVTIPQQYKQASNFAPEPSIRPLSKDVLANNAVLPRRPFASWSQMRHYYRMYRRDTDTPLPTTGMTDSLRQRNRNLNYTGGVPITGVHTPNDIRDDTSGTRWTGQNSYHRAPILARFLLIHAYATERFIHTDNKEYIAFHYSDVPVVTLWNPYSTPLILRSNVFGVQCGSPTIWPNRLLMYRSNGTKTSEWEASRLLGNVAIKSPDGADIVFAPGEFKVFSFKPGSLHTTRNMASVNPADWGLFEGFSPASIGGITEGWALWYKRCDQDIPGVVDQRNMEVQFYRPQDFGGRFVLNCFEGNAPGSLTLRLGPAGGDWRDGSIPSHHQIDWFQNSQRFQSITKDENGGLIPLVESPDPLPVGYSMMTLKTVNRIGVPASWDADWRSRNWLHAPPYGFGGGLYMSENATTAHTQRLDSAYEVSFGPTSPSELIKLTGEIDGKPWLGFGSNPYEKVTAVAATELPTAPISSLASFSGMRMNPGWIWSKDLNPDWEVRSFYGADRFSRPVSLYNAYAKIYGYQSGITGGGIGNSFIHPMIPRDKVYFYHDNSKSQEHANMELLRNDGAAADAALAAMTPVETKAYCDYWDHVLMLNDALWDDYFISSIADQTRPWASGADNLNANLASLTSGDGLPISRYQYHSGGLKDSDVKARLKAQDGYLKAAEHLIVDGAFNVNSTSVNAWYALFKGIRERKLFYRNSSGQLQEVNVPEGHIAVSRLDTPTSDQETTDLSEGVARADGHMEWSGVRFLNDEQLRLLAEKCVEQVKRRGPFLNFSEFINRRLENSELGLMGALQSAIDYDDASPDSKSINYPYKRPGNLRISPGDLGANEYSTPEAVEGSRLAGIPGYVIQSDLLKPIANTLQVRDDTFRIRAYGEALDRKGKVIARAWCEAIVQRKPEYFDPANGPYEPAYLYKGNPPDGTYDPGWNGEFVPNSALSPGNQRFGRKFEMKSFRWLAANEV